MKRIAILGSTGSIGLSALDVARHLRDRCRITGLAARRSWETLRDQVKEFGPTRAGLLDSDAADRLAPSLNGRTALLRGEKGLCELASADDVDIVLSAITGSAGLAPGLAALRAGKLLALANKESLVCAGSLMLDAAREGGTKIIPVDSEHSALYQAMLSGRQDEVARVIITGSGGPFRETPMEQLATVTVEQALRHPTWKMGGKITIDSATMMNKALEIVEAKWLFGIPADRIEVVVHPQSIVHSLVEFRDGSVVAQMGRPDMRVPIQYALTHPDRFEGNVKRLDLAEIGSLTFQKPDRRKFPSIDLGYRAARDGGTMGAVMNGANEAAVDAFLARTIAFPRIVETVAAVMDRHVLKPSPALEDIIEADRWARREAAALLSR